MIAVVDKDSILQHPSFIYNTCSVDDAVPSFSTRKEPSVRERLLSSPDTKTKCFSESSSSPEFITRLWKERSLISSRHRWSHWSWFTNSSWPSQRGHVDQWNEVSHDWPGRGFRSQKKDVEQPSLPNIFSLDNLLFGFAWLSDDFISSFQSSYSRLQFLNVHLAALSVVLFGQDCWRVGWSQKSRGTVMLTSFVYKETLTDECSCHSRPSSEWPNPRDFPLWDFMMN